MEEFRQQIVDRVVIRLVSFRQIKPDDCEMRNFVCMLSDSARRLLLKEVLERLDAKTQYGGRNLTYSAVIQSQARKAAKFLRREGRYSGFWQRW
jgi:CRISPR-associated protein Cas1